MPSKPLILADRITIYVIRKSWYSFTVIVSYRDKTTERFASGRHVKEFSGFARQAEMRLDRLETATSLADMAALPGNRLEALKGDRAGQFSIRINDQWRICFRWPEESPGPVDVEIVDYH
jgi:toxin HigB-1